MPRAARLSACLALALLATPAFARETLGIYESWGVFRDGPPRRCYAIAEPALRRRRAGVLQPFFAVSYWPAAGLRGQVHVRLRRVKKPGTAVFLAIGERHFLLASGKAEAWAPDTAADAAIVAAMRGGTSLSVTAVDRNGRSFIDAWALRGAATAIDAAALGCVGPG